MNGEFYFLYISNEIEKTKNIINEHFNKYNIQKSIPEFLGIDPKALDKSIIILKNFRIKNYLFKNGWILSPFFKDKDIFSILNNENIINYKNSDLNKIYEDFFCDNNYKNLELMISNYNNNKFFKKREKFFNSSLNILKEFRKNKKNVNKTNPSLFIIPILIAQIEGIGRDLSNELGLIHDRLRLLDEYDNRSYDKWYQWLFELPIGLFYDVNILRMIDDYLFENSYPYGQRDPNRNKVNVKSIRPFLKFNRNKILHGEDIKYGTIDNLIRCYLILDFLYYFSQKINGAQITQLGCQSHN